MVAHADVTGKFVYVGSADGVVTKLRVDTTPPKEFQIEKQSESLGYAAVGLVVGKLDGQNDEVLVATYRALHRLDLSLVPRQGIPNELALPWEHTRPTHLQIVDLFDDGQSYLLYTTQHGQLVVRDKDLNLVCDYPEPAIADLVVPGIQMTGGSLTMSGSVRPTGGYYGAVRCGLQNTVSGQFYTYAIVSDGGTVRIDPNVGLNPQVPHPPTSGTSTFTFEPIPFVFCRRGRPGDRIEPTLFGPPGAVGGLLVSFPLTRAVPTPLGPLWLDLSQAVDLGAGPLVQGALKIPTLLPHVTSDQVFRGILDLGTVLTFQGVVCDGSRVVLSEAVDVVLARQPKGNRQ
jgi:hypothetical protein